MNLLIGMATFITIVLFIEGGYVAFSALYNPERKRMRRRLRTLAVPNQDSAPVDVTRKRVLSEIPWLNAIFIRISLMQSVGRLLEQANSSYKVGPFLLLSLMLGCVGWLLGLLVLKDAPLTLAGAIGLGAMPLMYIYYQRRQRMRHFERQLPEALDLVARALKAGHTLLVGMKMVSDEFPDPIGIEFDRTVDEINFGASVTEALTNLSGRVDCADLRYFVTSVIVQRETGGNLADILEKTSHLIRQRFELHGRIRVLSAEGRLSAIVLAALPFLIGLTLYFSSRTYLMVLFTDPTGKVLLLTAGGTMALGMLVMRKMVNIRV